VRRAVPKGTPIAWCWLVTSGAKLPFAAAILGVLLGTAAPARAQAEAAAAGETRPSDDGAEAPEIELQPAPALLAAPMSEPEQPDLMMTRVVHRLRPGFLAAGGTTFGVSYTVAALLGFVTTFQPQDSPGDRRSPPPYYLLPVAGPLVEWWIMPASSRGSVTLWAVLSGVEAVGAAMLIVGFVGHDVVESRPLDAGPRVRVVPMFTGQQGALSLDVRW